MQLLCPSLDCDSETMRLGHRDLRGCRDGELAARDGAGQHRRMKRIGGRRKNAL
jgi:hypothetical protein